MSVATGLGTFFVVSDSMDEAAKRVTDMLNKNDYGFHSQRRVKSVSVITFEIDIDNKGKANINDDSRFLVSKPEKK